jgi:transcriptional regulator GlxA family with amidase domain
VVAWLRANGHTPARIMSVCTGAFLLADAGLLDDRKATTHWQYCASLAGRLIAEHPEADLSVPALAAVANLSPRQFSRAFTAEIGVPPGRATSHWIALDKLAEFGAMPVDERVVVDGKYATAAGVSAGIDLGLDLAGRLAGPEAAMTIQLGIEYDPAPPFSAGSPAKAPAPIVNFLREHPELLVKL